MIKNKAGFVKAKALLCSGSNLVFIISLNSSFLWLIHKIRFVTITTTIDHKIHNEWCHLGINNTQRGIWSLCHKIVLIIMTNIINTMICFWPLAPWAMETLKVSWRFPHEGLTLTQTLRKLRILFQLLRWFCWFIWRRWWWNLWHGIKVDLWKKLFYEQKQKPQSLWTALEAD